MMKVAFIARSTFFTDKGGDTFQAMRTAEGLAAIGVEADIKLTNEKIDYEKYDLLHFFNIIRPADVLCHVKRANKPFVVSTIFVDYGEYEQQHRKGIAGLLFRSLSADAIEYMKTIARWVLRKDKLMSLSYLYKGQRRSIVETLEQAQMLLPNSVSEQERLAAKYHSTTRYMVVSNGVDPTFFQFDKNIEKDPFLVLCVARIEGRKNQMNLLKAINGKGFRLLIIGSASPNHRSYYEDCKKAAADNISFIDHLPQDQLVSYYQRAKVHVLPSWFETTGLSSLEAALMGCNVVITDKGDTKEYFGDDAFYCDPASPTSILKAVEQAAAKGHSETLRQKILTRYTWQQASLQTMEAYKAVTKQRS